MWRKTIKKKIPCLACLGCTSDRECVNIKKKGIGHQKNTLSLIKIQEVTTI